MLVEWNGTGIPLLLAQHHMPATTAETKQLIAGEWQPHFLDWYAPGLGEQIRDRRNDTMGLG